MVLLILYGNLQVSDKNQEMFELLVHADRNVILYESGNIPRIIEHIVTITCLCISDFLDQNAAMVFDHDNEIIASFGELYGLF